MSKQDIDVSQLKEKLNVNGLDTFQVVSGRDTVYAEKGGAVTANKLTPQIVEQINAAIADPSALKGSFRVMSGRDKLFHLKSGEILEDKLGITQEKALDTVQKRFTRDEILDFPSDATNHLSFQDSLLAIDDRYQHFQSQVQEQANRLGILAKQAYSLAQQTSKHSIEVARSNPKVNAWLKEVKGKAEESFREVAQKASVDLQVVQEGINSRTPQGLKQAASRLSEWNNKNRPRIQQPRLNDQKIGLIARSVAQKMGTEQNGKYVADFGGKRFEASKGETSIIDRQRGLVFKQTPSKTLNNLTQGDRNQLRTFVARVHGLNQQIQNSRQQKPNKELTLS